MASVKRGFLADLQD